MYKDFERLVERARQRKLLAEQETEAARRRAEQARAEIAARNAGRANARSYEAAAEARMSFSALCTAIVDALVAQNAPPDIWFISDAGKKALRAARDKISWKQSSYNLVSPSQWSTRAQKRLKTIERDVAARHTFPAWNMAGVRPAVSSAVEPGPDSEATGGSGSKIPTETANELYMGSDRTVYVGYYRCPLLSSVFEYGRCIDTGPLGDAGQIRERELLSNQNGKVMLGLANLVAEHDLQIDYSVIN